MWSCAVILHHLTKLIYQLNEESIFLIIFKDNSKFNLMSCLVSKIQVASLENIVNINRLETIFHKPSQNLTNKNSFLLLYHGNTAKKIRNIIIMLIVILWFIS